jgi:hypothetical protein
MLHVGARSAARHLAQQGAPEAEALLTRWGRLHAVRSTLSLGAFASFFISGRAAAQAHLGPLHDVGPVVAGHQGRGTDDLAAWVWQPATSGRPRLDAVQDAREQFSERDRPADPARECRAEQNQSHCAPLTIFHQKRLDPIPQAATR